MKKIIAILTLSLILTGCFNYRDINRLIFVTSVLIDIDDNDNIIMYAEAFSSSRGTGEAAGQETRVILKGSGETMFEAIREMATTSSYMLNYTQNKAIIFSEKAAEYGLNKFIDILIRDQEFLVRQFIYISTIDLEELLKIELTEETYLGIFLFDLSDNMPARTRDPQMRIDQYFVSRKLGNKINGLSLIHKAENVIDDRIEINTLAVMNEDKMIGILGYHETFFYNIATDNLQLGYIKIPNPDAEDSLITLEILKLRTKTHVKYDGGNIVDITKKVNIRTTIASAQETFNISNIAKRNRLQEAAAHHIKQGATDLYEKYEDQEIDIYNLKRAIDQKYPNANVDKDNILKSINLTIDVNVFIEGSTDVIDFY